jgi:integrase
LLCPGLKTGGRNSGMLSFEGLRARADKACADAGLRRITAHECRHTCATWLDAAGVRPVVVSQLMGHATPTRQAGAAHITQERYTHALPGDLEQARRKLDGFLTEQAQQEQAGETITR